MKTSQDKLSKRRNVKLEKIKAEPETPAESGYPLKETPQDITTSITDIMIGDSQFSADDIEIKEELGKGASSTVFHVVVKPTGDNYALKRIRYSQSKEMKQIITELHCLNILRHQNIVRLYTAYYKESAINIVMSLIDGGSLLDHLKYSPKVPEPALGRIAHHVVQGLLYLRRNHFIHRDLKPSNILLSQNGDVKIADFGMARQLTASIEQVQSVLGTICYMAPERLNGKSYGFKSDVWSFGMIIYQCALGRFPYDGDLNSMKYWDLFENFKTDPKITISNEYSPMLTHFCSRCLIANADEREGIESLVNHPWIQAYKDPSAQAPLTAWINSNLAQMRDPNNKPEVATLGTIGLVSTKY